RLLEVLSELPFLKIIEAEVRCFIGDVLPSEHFPRIIAQGIRRFRHGPNEPALERARGRTVLLRCSVNKRNRRLFRDSMVWREHDEGQARRIGDLTALIREVYRIDDCFPLREGLLNLSADTLFHAG